MFNLSNNRKKPVRHKRERKDENAHVYKVDDVVLCKYPTDGFFYTAKIVKEAVENDQKFFLVHYQGWSSRHDEWVFESDSGDRFSPYSPQAAKEAEEAVREARSTARSRSSKRSRKSNPLNDLDTGTTCSSRSNTPSLDTPLRRSAVRTPKSDSKGNADENSNASGGRPALDLFDHFPRNLIDLLIQDRKKVNKGMIATYAGSYNVDKIVDMYVERVNSGEQDHRMDAFSTRTTVEMQTQAALFVRDLFNCAFRARLLYASEKKYHDDRVAHLKTEQKTSERVASGAMSAESNNLEASRLYGLPHLLRLFTRFSEYASELNCGHNKFDLAAICVQDFLLFLSENVNLFFNKNYTKL